MPIITSKHLHDGFDFKYGWIKKHFAIIRLDFKMDRANVYRVSDMLYKAQELYQHDLNYSHARQNYTRLKLLEKLIAVLSDHLNKEERENHV